MITRDQFKDFDVDALFTHYENGVVTRTRIGWDGYLAEFVIDPTRFPAAERLIRMARQNRTGVARGFRFVAVLAPTKHGKGPGCTLKEALQTLLQETDSARPYVVQDDVVFTLYRDGSRPVINFVRRKGGDLTRDDVDWTRAALADLGYDIVEEWLPMQGVSWLSGGVGADVSFRLEARS